MAERGLAPNIFRRRTRHTRAPGWCFVAATVVIFAVINLNFNSILNVTNILNCVSLTMILVAALALRCKYPDKHRPFRVPCGNAGLAVAVVAPSLAVLFMVGILIATQVRTVDPYTPCTRPVHHRNTTCTPIHLCVQMHVKVGFRVYPYC